MSPNEARAKMGGLPNVEHGDNVYVQSQMVPLGYEPPEPEVAPEPVVEEQPQEDPEESKGAAVYYLKELING